MAWCGVVWCGSGFLVVEGSLRPLSVLSSVRVIFTVTVVVFLLSLHYTFIFVLAYLRDVRGKLSESMWLVMVGKRKVTIG